MGLDHLLELGRLLLINFDTFLNIRHCKYLLCGFILAGNHQLLHKLIVGNRELPPSSKTCTRVHKKTYKYPALRIHNLIYGKIPGIHLINSFHHIVKARELVLAAVILVNDTGT